MEPSPVPLLPLHRQRAFYLSLLVLILPGLAWLGSIFAADSLLINLPPLARTFTVGQSDGMIGLGSQSRSATVNFGCGAPLFGSYSSPLCLWRNPHGRPRFAMPPPVSWEANEYYWSVGVSHWLLYAPIVGGWIAWLTWRSRQTKKLRYEDGATSAEGASV